MNKQFLLKFLATCFLLYITLGQPTKLTEFETFPHNKNCYSQGLFFLNSTHLFESCGWYRRSYFHILKYKMYGNQFRLEEEYTSQTPINKDVFLEGATWFPKTDKIYILTWRENIVYQINRESFAVQKQLKWEKNGWGLTNNQTHMFITDGSANIYLVDEKFQILQKKLIIDQNNRKVFSLNQLQLVKEGDKEYIYANVYMERRIVKIDYETGQVVKEYDSLKIIQNQKGLKHDQVINGVARNPQNGKYILTGKNWGNFYQVDF